jgi:gamma-glutamylcyclotransferase (GGCT)/AIG2-like uncharacterized protein YtfP
MGEAEMIYVFLYGGDRLEKHFRSDISLCKAVVHDWALVFGNHLNSGIASIVPFPGRDATGCVARLSESQFESIQEYEGIKLIEGVYESIDVPATIVGDQVHHYSENMPTKAFVLSRTALVESIHNYVPPHPSYLKAIWWNLSAHWDLSGQDIQICRVASLGAGGAVSLTTVDAWRPLPTETSTETCAPEIAKPTPHLDEAGVLAPPTAARIFPPQGRVFVATYGTLRRGMPNYHVNVQGGGVLFCAGRTADAFSLYRCRGADFPCLSLRGAAPHSHPVAVDVFEVRRRRCRPAAMDSILTLLADCIAPQ